MMKERLFLVTLPIESYFIICLLLVDLKYLRDNFMAHYSCGLLP